MSICQELEKDLDRVAGDYPGATSSETKERVHAHIRECESCRTRYKEKAGEFQDRLIDMDPDSIAG